MNVENLKINFKSVAVAKSPKAAKIAKEPNM